MLNDEIDLSLQIECAEIAARGLHFYPVVYMPEIGVPFHTPPEVPRGYITLEQAVQYRWMFAETPEQSLYETALLHEAARRQAEIIRSVKSVQYELPSLMLTPGSVLPQTGSFTGVYSGLEQGNAVWYCYESGAGLGGDGLCPRLAATAAVPLGKAVRPEAGSGGRIKKKENPLRRIRASSPEGASFMSA